jgi:hypothetical protein
MTLKNVRLLLTAMEQLGVPQFEVEAVDIVHFDDLGRVRTQPEVVAKVYDKDTFREWCLEENLKRELNMHPGTVASLTRVRLLNGGDEPPGVQAFVNTKFAK